MRGSSEYEVRQVSEIFAVSKGLVPEWFAIVKV